MSSSHLYIRTFLAYQDLHFAELQIPPSDAVSYENEGLFHLGAMRNQKRHSFMNYGEDSGAPWTEETFVYAKTLLVLTTKRVIHKARS